ncbi:MAG: UbiA family prenyltransferase [Proteobacteria bacterium]|nr:UbiA family prenyltransferase [Pseudomonadota bacterium]
MSSGTVPSAPASDIPLCVDLDGTVLKTDLLYETVLTLVRAAPGALLALPVWVLRGRGHLKREIASRVEVRPDVLPYRDDLLQHLRAERERGRRIFLVTASDQALAQKVSDHLAVFDEVIGSTAERNLKGVQKARYLAERFGAQRFDYIGDARADLAVWKEARGGAVVTSSPVQPELQHIEAEPLRLKAVFKAIRVHQWVKNVLIFVPVLLAHKVLSLQTMLPSAMAFAAFSLCASVVYLINDLLDLESDRLHPRKRFRPLASGLLPIGAALMIIPLFALAAFALAINLPVQFGITLAGYVALTFGYSLFFKQIALVDIVLLAALYAIRILAGGAAAEVLVSKWLLAFAMFFFFSLACVKRYSELFSLRLANKQHASGRGYRASDLEQIGAFGAASGYLSILVLALYINSGEVTALYRSPGFLWLLCPVLLYWVSRVWLISHRGEMHDDPIVFALTDRVSYFVGILTVLVVLLAL